MAWLLLILSALLEVVWATAFAASEGFTRLVPVIVLLVAVIASALGLAYAVRRIRIVRAYVVWLLISALVTAGWALLTGVAQFTVVMVVLLVLAIGIVAGLQLLGWRASRSEPEAVAVTE